MPLKLLQPQVSLSTHIVVMGKVHTLNLIPFSYFNINCLFYICNISELHTIAIYIAGILKLDIPNSIGKNRA